MSDCSRLCIALLPFPGQCHVGSYARLPLCTTTTVPLRIRSRVCLNGMRAATGHKVMHVVRSTSEVMSTHWTRELRIRRNCEPGLSWPVCTRSQTSRPLSAFKEVLLRFLRDRKLESVDGIQETSAVSCITASLPRTRWSESKREAE